MKNKIITAVFAIMTAAFVLLLLYPADTDSISGENRELSGLPEFTADSVFSGRFSEEFESFVDDNIGFRSFFTSLSEKLNAKKGIETPAGRLVWANSDMGTGDEKKSGFLIVNDHVFELFMRNKATEDKYTDAVNHYAKNLDNNIQLYLAVIPTSLEFEEDIYANTEDSQKETINYIKSRLDERVKTVDMYSELQNHSGEYIYFRTDHHWTQLGAYYGYRAFLAASGGTAVNASDFPQDVIPDFLGSLYTQSSAVELSEKPDTIEWYNTAVNNDIEISMRRYGDNGAEIYRSPIFNEEYSDSYRFFLSGDNPFVELTNKNNPTGKTLLIVRDSFANAFAPWIIHNYKKVVLIDPRSRAADFSEIVDEFKPDEVLIMNYIFSAAFEGYGELLTDLYRAP